MACSIARTMDVIGEPWSPLVLRNVFIGITRFEQLQQSLGISRKVLAERLRWLTDNGVLDRRQYSSRPPRYEYVLTAKGQELVDVLMVMVRWGDRWLAGEAGPPVLYRHRACGQISHVELTLLTLRSGHGLDRYGCAAGPRSRARRGLARRARRYSTRVQNPLGEWPFARLMLS